LGWDITMGYPVSSSSHRDHSSLDSRCTRNPKARRFRFSDLIKCSRFSDRAFWASCLNQAFLVFCAGRSWLPVLTECSRFPYAGYSRLFTLIECSRFPHAGCWIPFCKKEFLFIFTREIQQSFSLFSIIKLVISPT